ncbi:MAG: thioredoxin [Candidatus Omnitrophica bacterium]|nr:thioredoxin [Candidatus Omnitrophota bacterium]
MGAIHVNEQNFDAEVMKSPIAVLVDFWAEWCGPCRMMGPVIDAVAEEMQGKVKVVKVNIDEAQGLAEQFNVMSIPTLAFIKNGEVVDVFVGAMPKEALVTKLQKHI